ncbi:[Fructose-bisphosphate aldolase]-lysine N-methyltransferase, chloroplastic [Quillaja saponaria]|uniref:[Fructose-bisphosphate aldolase]-lysine N-methyltransferase, chloroplastic n=1 Tax=Quillaja saponaria TaxID=32244 RepID=A0AAD7QDE0_QUISA|nr:[Fructose-bisphosphate aldolase]-lysine N-methyltransferase, chloroplastic [Quillaja saponaria]
MATDKALLYDTNTETDWDCSIVLELSEDDVFFDKKKKLLQNKGFSTKERVYFKSSLDPKWMNTTVKALLQIARIILLDEVELYFAEDNGCSPVEYYSHKNEIVALNSIISSIDNSITSSLSKKNRSCDLEEDLLKWGESNGVQTRLQIAYVQGAGRGAIAKEDLKVGDMALEIPVSIIISDKLVHESDMYHVLGKIDGISSETMLLLWSMKEKHNCNSKFKIYFDSLPEQFNTGLSFGVEAIMNLDGTLLLEEVTQAREHLHAQYDELFPTLCNDHPDVFPPELYTWEHFLWACELWYSNSMKIMFSDGKLRTCLIPIAGFLNHSLCPHIMQYGKVDTAKNSLQFHLSRPCKTGEECFLSYGNLSSSHLITFYGFYPQGDNPYDVIPLDLDAPEADSTEDTSMSDTDRIAHMVRGTWHSKNHDIFYYGLPSALLNHLRRSRSPVLQTKTLLQENLTDELELLEDLHVIFDDMMENFADTDHVNRENTSWDVKLAVDFTILQRSIVSSILTSFHSGIKMVKYEFDRCMAEELRG